MPTFRQDEKLGTKVPLLKTADFNDKSVTTEKLAEGSVTNSKLAPESVTQDKFDKELLQIFEAAAGLPKNLIETIQNVDSTLVDHQRQISSNDDDISDLQTKTKQIKDTVDGIAISGGASAGSAVTYDNTQSGLDALNIQNAIDELVNNLGHYETNEEWLRVYTDAENKFLWGIRVDGSIDWAVGIPKPIQKALNEIIGNNESFQQTLTEAMEAYKATIDEKVAVIDEKKVDKEEGKSLIEDAVKECFRVIENEEFIKAIVDAEDRVLFGIYRDTGKPYYPLNDMYHISQSEEFLWVILDAANHPLLGIQQDGTCWAAKAQWLNDIKAIKKALSSIDETLKTFQPKEDGKGLINLDVADSFFYISNDEYIIAVVDAENRILAAIKYDAQPYFPNHEMYSVVTNEEWLYAIIDEEDKVLCGFRANDGHMVVGGIDISTFIANAIIDIADIKERTAHLSTMDNDEYLSVETDAEGKVIGYIAPDGSHYLYKVKSETIPTEFSHIEDLEGRTEITTDAEGKILGYREEDGTRFENSFKTKKLSLPSDGLSDFAKQLSKSGLTSSGACDWSNYNSNNGEKPLQLPIPNCAIINISNADKSASWAESKNSNFVYTLEYSDMQGNYFKKNIIMNAQGNSSLMMIKKNASIDLFDESVYDSEGNKGNGDAFSIKFGDWVAQDGFHLKAFYNDFFKGCSFIVYQIANEVMKSYGLTKDRPWKRALIGDYAGTGQDGKQIDDISLQIDNGARCMPDGFPCIAYLNGKFYGIFTFALKKHRDNYHMSKKKAEHIHLDGTNQTFFDGTIKWSDFEVRNPKSSEMCCTTLKEGTTEYESYTEGKELLGDDAEYFDNKNKAHVLSSKVKRSIESLSKRLTETKALNSPTEQKAYIEKYFDVDSILDYILVATATHETDGGFANWQWITYDGIKWYICNYDKDRSFGNDNEYLHPAITEGSWMYENVSIFKFFEDLYSKELKDKWNEYVQKGIFTYENFIGKINSWVQRIGQANYEKEYDKWKEAPCNRDNLSDTEHWMLVDRADTWTWYKTYKEGSYCCDINTTKVYKAIKQSNNISVTNTEYWQDITYEASKQYNINDICGYGFSFGNIDNGFYVFKAIVNTLGNVPIKGTYGNYPRVMGYRDNIWRISNYVRQTLETIQRFVDNL